MASKSEAMTDRTLSRIAPLGHAICLPQFQHLPPFVVSPRPVITTRKRAMMSTSRNWYLEHGSWFIVGSRPRCSRTASQGSSDPLFPRLGNAFLYLAQTTPQQRMRTHHSNFVDDSFENSPACGHGHGKELRIQISKSASHSSVTWGHAVAVVP